MMNSVRRCRPVALFAMALAWVGIADRAAAQLCVQLNGATYRQNFNSLPASGTSNIQSTVPIGFAFSEAGTGNNVTFAASDGTSSTNNTYSYGSTGNSDRAFGELGGDSFQSTCGACFVNNTGLVINSMSVSYTGEQWRLGAADGNTDRLDFQFSTTATALNDGTVTDGTWIDVNSLDFASPTIAGAVGAKDGNAAANRTTKGPIAIIPGQRHSAGRHVLFPLASAGPRGQRGRAGHRRFLTLDQPDGGLQPGRRRRRRRFPQVATGQRHEKRRLGQRGRRQQRRRRRPAGPDALAQVLRRPAVRGVGAAGSVPEPASAALMAVVVGSLAAARRRGHSGYVEPVAELEQRLVLGVARR